MAGERERESGARLGALGLTADAVDTLLERGLRVAAFEQEEEKEENEEETKEEKEEERGSALDGIELTGEGARVRFGTTWALIGRSPSILTLRIDDRTNTTLIGRFEGPGAEDALIYVAEDDGRIFADVDLVEPFLWADNACALFTRFAIDLKMRTPFSAQPAALWGAGSGDDLASSLKLELLHYASDRAERRWSDGTWMLAELLGTRPGLSPLQLWHVNDESLRGWSTEVPSSMEDLCTHCNRVGRDFRAVPMGRWWSGDVGTIRP